MMTPRRGALAFLILTLALAACGPRPAPQASADSAVAGMPDTIPHPPAADSTDPAQVIQSYYDAINRRDFRTAFMLWSDSGRASGKTLQQFEAGFAGTDSSRVEVGEAGRVEGAAGSRYVEVPVTIRAWRREGSRQTFTGSYVLRRAVVDGATDAQRKWHLYSADIHERRDLSGVD
ncbi:MAG TPA: hypothetical protein VFO96_01410 [Gemmatimonadales bacterium]|jgi:hypothetical protein|nr:hypothetical protein [Gemmatimonadales bacterium]